MGEHFLDVEGVGGSSPSCLTIFYFSHSVSTMYKYCLERYEYAVSKHFYYLLIVDTLFL